MGGQLSKNHPETNSSTDITSYKAACKMDSELPRFNSTPQARTSQVISSPAVGVEFRSLSFDSLREVTECLLEMNQEVVKVILECKQDIWKSQELFELVEEYFENSLQTLDFCAALEKCLKRARDSQLLVMVALQQFEEESEPGEIKYSRTLEELKAFKAAGSPFTEEFLQIFQAVYKQQIAMLEKLQQRKNKLDKKLNYIRAWRKVSNIIVIATFASVLICSVVAAATAAPVASVLAAVAAIPLATVRIWIDSIWKNFENVVKGQKAVICWIQVVTSVTNKYLKNIQELTGRLEIEIGNLMSNAEVAIEDDDAVELAITEIKKTVVSFVKNVEDLGLKADMCSRDIRRARTLVLQRIIKPPNN